MVKETRETKITEGFSTKMYHKKGCFVNFLYNENRACNHTVLGERISFPEPGGRKDMPLRW